MKQQYESEILNKLMERDGFNIPSSVPPYEAEIKAYLINQVKQAYPKLTDYEAEWLLYNYTKHLPADFPISSVTNVTNATFENVVPYAYQSAILKGNTLVNLCQTKSVKVASNPTGDKWTELPLTYNLPVGKYLFVVNGLKNSSANIQGFRFGDANNNYTWGFYQKSFTGKSYVIMNFTTPITRLHHYASYNEGEISYDEIMIIPYQEGMENWDIPYFEGMQSVKMPVLHSVGKNLYNPNTAYVVGIHKQDVSNKVDVKPNTDYTFYANGHEWTQVILYNNTGQITRKLGQNSASTEVIFTTTNDEVQATLVFYYGSDTVIENVDFTGIQLEEGSAATSYEPYKSNILSTSEDVTLRGIGEVQDTLDCLTGEVTERIGEIVLDGSEGWRLSNNLSEVRKCYVTDLTNVKLAESNSVTTINNRMSSITYNLAIKDKQLGIFARTSTNGLGIIIDIEYLIDFKTYLQQNPITVQYVLATESIKTVDLKTINENGETVYFMPLEGTMHAQSSGEIIQPTFDMSVPVEATTQNLASFIDMEMER